MVYLPAGIEPFSNSLVTNAKQNVITLILTYLQSIKERIDIDKDRITSLQAALRKLCDDNEAIVKANTEYTAQNDTNLNNYLGILDFLSKKPGDSLFTLRKRSMWLEGKYKVSKRL